jgi:hypothetical protein
MDIYCTTADEFREMVTKIDTMRWDAQQSTDAANVQSHLGLGTFVSKGAVTATKY